MLHGLGRRLPALFTLAFILGLAPVAAADVPPDPPKEEKPDAEKPDAEKPDAKSKGGNCSVSDAKLELTGLAALALLIAGATLRRRRA